MTQYVCTNLVQQPETGVMVCTTWQAIPDYSGYKLTNEQMADFIFSIAALFATVAAIKLVRRSFF